MYFAKSIISFSDMSKGMLVRVFAFFLRSKKCEPFGGQVKTREVEKTKFFQRRSLKLQRKDGKYILIPVDVFYKKESFYWQVSYYQA